MEAIKIVPFFVTTTRWRSLYDLPGIKIEPLYHIGQKLFQTFDNVDLTEITVCIDQPYLKDLMQKVSNQEKVKEKYNLEFHDILEGYQADCITFIYKNYHLLFVRDFNGLYCYKWPYRKLTLIK